jgi:O-antigen/teichoic acid export membrane protein
VPFDWRGLVKQVLPLLFGFGAYQFLLTADTMFMKVYFDDSKAAPYVGAGTLSRATIWVVGPLAAVMFPKIVHAKAKSENTNIMNTVLLGTLILAVGGAVGLTVVGPFVVKYIFPTMAAGVAKMLPWYAWAVVPLSLANVLVNNLLARSLTKVVFVLCLLAPLYAFALTQFHASTIQVIQVLGIFNTLLFLVCAWYTWSPKHRLQDKPAPEPTL